MDGVDASEAAEAPRGVALEIAASDALNANAGSEAEKEQLRSDLRRWVQHCLQMDHALAAAEKRAAELSTQLRQRNGNKSSPKELDSPYSSGDDPSDSTAKETPGGRPRKNSMSPGNVQSSPEQSWAPAPMSQEVHKALLEQSLLPPGRSLLPGRDKGKNSATAAAGPGMIKLLLVEDDTFQAEAILSLCEQCGYRAQVASSASEALDLVRAQPEINLVLSDVMMEGTSGCEPGPARSPHPSPPTFSSSC